MLKILTPNDLIIQEIKRDDFLLEFIDSINSNLSSFDEYPSNGFKFNITTDDDITKRQQSLLKYIFGIYGWNLFITSYGKGESGKYHYVIFMIEQHKIVLN